MRGNEPDFSFVEAAVNFSATSCLVKPQPAAQFIALSTQYS